MFNDAIDRIATGTSREIFTVFRVPLGTDMGTLSGKWEIFDSVSDEVRLSSDAIDISQVPWPDNIHVKLLGTLDVPANMRSTSENYKYQIRWVLNASRLIQPLYTYEMLTIDPNIESDAGIRDTVELYRPTTAGQCPVTLNAVLPQEDNPANLYVYRDEDNPVYAGTVVQSTRGLSNGYLYRHTIDLVEQEIRPTLVPYSVIWEYDDEYDVKQQENGNLYVITPAIMQAMRDLDGFVNSINRDIVQDLRIPAAESMGWLRGGMDKFNGTGLFTNFTMIRARDVIRHWWLEGSKISALKSMYLREGARTFDFAGQSVTLNSDITQYIDTLANSISEGFNTEVPLLKRHLHQRGITGGDGATTRGSNTGALQLTLGPASNIGMGSRGLLGRYNLHR